MSNYNRTNPFLYIFGKLIDEFEHNSLLFIKISILQHITLAITISVVIANVIINKKICIDFIFLISFIIGVNITIANYGISIINKSQAALPIGSSDSGSKLTYTYINNEKIFDDIILINKFIGQLSGIRKIIYWMIILMILIIVSYFVNIVIAII